MTTDYIKREDAIKVLEEDIPITDNPVEVMASAIATLEELPSADVVEVVRCKDCKYHAEFSSKCNKLHLTPMLPNYYRSYGERRE